MQHRDGCHSLIQSLSKVNTLTFLTCVRQQSNKVHVCAYHLSFSPSIGIKYHYSLNEYLHYINTDCFCTEKQLFGNIGYIITPAILKE